MKIVLIGYGKMGKTIERIALERGHSVILKITSSNKDLMIPAELQKADVAIEFTVPEGAPENVTKCLNAGIPVVCGTTGWNNQLDAAKALAERNGVSFLQASNFSIGVNIFFEINKTLAHLMDSHPEYSASIEEVHHTQKKDAPSGTAITLAEQIISESQSLQQWKLAENANTGDLPITAIREEGVPGTHTISWNSKIDSIDIVHTAHGRDGFALGAVLAAEFIAGKKGVFTMRDVLGLK